MIFRKLIISTIILLFAFSSSLKAQLCTGSLGDPIVKFTFGYDTLGFGLPPSPLAPGITNYTFAPNSCPPDGSYTITDNTSGCFGGTWYDLPEDHTPNDQYGYMMLVNATATPGEFYTQTVTGLCGGTTYEFAAWILNLNVPTACGGTPTKPNITFDILTTTGTLLQTYNTSNIGVTPFASWKQYGTFFTTPPTTTSVVIRMKNNAPGGCGNDIALDDITFRPCGATVTAVINGSATSINVCAGNVSSNTFTGAVSASGPTTAFQWQISTDTGATWTDIPGATGMTYVPTVTTQGAYQYRFTVAQAPGTPPSCRTISNIIFFNVDTSPAVPAFISADTTCISNQPVVFTEQPQNTPGIVVEWDWNFGDGPTITVQTNAPQSHTYAAPGTYTVTLQVKNATGCLSAAFSKVIVITGAPTVDFTYSNTCENNPVNFTSITNAGADASYAWTFGDVPVTSSTDPNPIKTYSAGGTYNVTLTITSFGCSSTITKPVALTAKPATPSFTAPATGCVNQVITFQPATTSGGITQWTWNFGDNSAVVTSATNIAQTHPYTTAGTYTATLQVSANGCMSDLFQQTITINNAPTVDFTFNDTCAGFPITFSSSTNAGSGAQYAWTFGDQTLSSDVNPVKTFTGSGTYNVSLTITLGGCSATITHPVVVIPILSAPVVTTDSIGTDYLKFKWLPVTGAVAYKVSIDGGANFTDPSSGATGTTHYVRGLTPGQTVNIIVKAIGANACENSTGNATGITKIANLDIYIPNTFTPNGDGKNDQLKIYGNNIKLVNMKIFNQWGEMIFATTDKDHGWDGTYKGKIQPVGVYVYAVTVTLQDGKIINRKGSINLVK